MRPPNWRPPSNGASGRGRLCATQAQAALQAATADGSWKNDAATNAAPFASKILQYLTPSNILTTTTSRGDLICCIRAGGINDVELMKAVSVDEMGGLFCVCQGNQYLCVQQSFVAGRQTPVSVDGEFVGGGATCRWRSEIPCRTQCIVQEM
jgi:hypothetical protein